MEFILYVSVRTSFMYTSTNVLSAFKSSYLLSKELFTNFILYWYLMKMLHSDIVIRY